VLFLVLFRPGRATAAAPVPANEAV
jgi:hypothetical protein